MSSSICSSCHCTVNKCLLTFSATLFLGSWLSWLSWLSCEAKHQSRLGSIAAAELWHCLAPRGMCQNEHSRRFAACVNCCLAESASWWRKNCEAAANDASCAAFNGRVEWTEQASANFRLAVRQVRVDCMRVARCTFCGCTNWLCHNWLVTTTKCQVPSAECRIPTVNSCFSFIPACRALSVRPLTLACMCQSSGTRSSELLLRVHNFTN